MECFVACLQSWRIIVCPLALLFKVLLGFIVYEVLDLLDLIMTKVATAEIALDFLKLVEDFGYIVVAQVLFGVLR